MKSCISFVFTVTGLICWGVFPLIWFEYGYVSGGWEVVSIGITCSIVGPLMLTTGKKYPPER